MKSNKQARPNDAKACARQATRVVVKVVVSMLKHTNNAVTLHCTHDASHSKPTKQYKHTSPKQTQHSATCWSVSLFLTVGLSQSGKEAFWRERACPLAVVRNGRKKLSERREERCCLILRHVGAARLLPPEREKGK